MFYFPPSWKCPIACLCSINHLVLEHLFSVFNTCSFFIWKASDNTTTRWATAFVLFFFLVIYFYGVFQANVVLWRNLTGDWLMCLQQLIHFSCYTSQNSGGVGGSLNARCTFVLVPLCSTLDYFPLEAMPLRDRALLDPVIPLWASPLSCSCQLAKFVCVMYERKGLWLFNPSMWPFVYNLDGSASNDWCKIINMILYQK
jgi:hypothetical protein